MVMKAEELMILQMILQEANCRARVPAPLRSPSYEGQALSAPAYRQAVYHFHSCVNDSKLGMWKRLFALLHSLQG